MKRFLFVCGCPRSGTTELARLLNQHNDIYIGCERYLYLYHGGAVAPESFSAERFSTLNEGETFYNSLDDMEGWVAGERYSQDGSERIKTARIVGDKVPSLIYCASKMKSVFPDETMWIAAIRDIVSVIRSWMQRASNPSDSLWSSESQIEDAIIHWTSSLCSFIDLRTSGLNIVDVYTPHLYNSDKVEITRMLERLDLEHDAKFSEYIDGSIQWVTANPRARHLIAKEPTASERDKILSHSYVKTTVQKLVKTGYRVELDTLFWEGFCKEYLYAFICS